MTQTIDDLSPKGEATPRPWMAEPQGGKGSWIKGATGEWSAMSCGETHASAEANADLIVRAVNSYDALYAAADAAHAFLSIVMPTSHTAEAREITAQLRAALSLARGEKA